MPANLVFYPYQLENGSYIDKISNKPLSVYGSLNKYPVNFTPYNNSNKDYIGGAGIYKPSSNAGAHIYGNYDIVKNIDNFTIYFWTYTSQSNDDFWNKLILTIDQSGGYEGIGITSNGIILYTGDTTTTFATKANTWHYHEISFQKSGSNYIIKGYFNGVKKYTYTVSNSLVHQNKFFITSWSFDNYDATGYYGYVYDLSIYDDILHTENFTDFPIKEMDYRSDIWYTGYENKDNLYG